MDPRNYPSHRIRSRCTIASSRVRTRYAVIVVWRLRDAKYRMLRRRILLLKCLSSWSPDPFEAITRIACRQADFCWEAFSLCSEFILFASAWASLSAQLNLLLHDEVTFQMYVY